VTHEQRVADLVDQLLDTMEAAGVEGEAIDPLSIILERLQARGASLDLEGAPPMMRMLLGGMIG